MNAVFLSGFSEIGPTSTEKSELLPACLGLVQDQGLGFFQGLAVGNGSYKRSGVFLLDRSRIISLYGIPS